MPCSTFHVPPYPFSTNYVLRTFTMYQDIFLTCADCQTEFIYTRGQQWLAQQSDNTSIPSVCPVCMRYRQRVHALATPDPVTGVVKWYDLKKGYGFLTLDDGRDIFLHSSGIAEGKARAVRRGKRVRAIIQQSDKGPTATEVEVVK